MRRHRSGQEQPEVLLTVRVQPRAREEGIVLLADGTVLVQVKALPAAGRANEAVIAALAKRLGIPKGQVRLVRGRTSRMKTVAIRSLEMEEVLLRLAPEN